MERAWKDKNIKNIKFDEKILLMREIIYPCKLMSLNKKSWNRIKSKNRKKKMKKNSALPLGPSLSMPKQWQKVETENQWHWKNIVKKICHWKKSVMKKKSEDCHWKIQKKIPIKRFSDINYFN